MTADEFHLWLRSVRGITRHDCRAAGRVTEAMTSKLYLMPWRASYGGAGGPDVMRASLAEALTLRVFKPWERKVLLQFLAEESL